MKNTLSRFFIISVILMLSFVISCNQQEEKISGENKVKDDLQLNKMPQVVMDALKSKFPKAEIHKLTKEKEGDIVVYDIEFKQEGRNLNAFAFFELWCFVGRLNQWHQPDAYSRGMSNCLSITRGRFYLTVVGLIQRDTMTKGSLPIQNRLNWTSNLIYS